MPSRGPLRGASQFPGSHMHRFLSLFLAVFLVTLGATAAPALAKKKSPAIVSTALAPSFGGGTGGSGTATHEDRGKRETFTIEVEGIPMGFYDVFVGGARVADLTVSPTGTGSEGTVEFDTKRTAGKRRLNFDPRGKAIEIRNALVVVLAGTLPAGPVGQPSFSDYADTIASSSPGTGRRPRGSLKIRSTSEFAWMRFELQHLARVSHTITANGVPIATVYPMAGGIGRVQLSSDPSGNDVLLDFDPAGVTYRVMKADELVMEFISDPGTIGGGMEPVRLTTKPLAPTGVQPPAQGAATLTARGPKLDLKIEVGSLIPGPYSLRIAGSTEGSIHISLSSDPTRALLELSNYRSGPGVFPLGIDPRGRDIEIVGNGFVVLRTVFPN
jgi:hypothetical protein